MGSTLDWVMISSSRALGMRRSAASRWILALGFLLFGLWGWPVLGLESDKVPEFLATQFPEPPPSQKLAVSGDLAREAKAILGHAYPGKVITYWREGKKSVFLLVARGKTGLFTTGIVVEGDRIQHTEVLDYRESRGKEVRSRAFLNQFFNCTLTPDRKLSRRVDAVSGATISCGSMKNAARLALFLSAWKPSEP